MNSNTKVYETLEFAKIQAQVQQYIQTELGKDKVHAMRISADLDQLEEWQLETEQALGILTQRKVMPIPRLNNLAPALRRLKLEASLNALEIAQVGRLLKTIKQLITFFDELAEDDKVYPALSKWVDQCVHLLQIEKLIEQSITEDGKVLWTDSTVLASNSRQKTQTEEQIRNQLNQLVKSKASQLSDTLVTMRNDVYVLPVKAEYRNQFGGRIHDQSSTGQTLYIEP